MGRNYQRIKKRGFFLAVLVSAAFAKAQVTQTFSYTGTIETFTVPPCVTSLTIESKGAQGGYNMSSTTASGLGADITGVISVTSGQVLQILVGEQPSGSNGGGGGSFVTDISNNPLVIAGGGGGSCQGIDSPNKHGQVGTSGGLGAGGGGAGGTGGNGGGVGPYFSSGGGGGLLTDGTDGWIGGSGGKSYLNGGAGGTAGAAGGFGGGGSGSGYIVGGGGGGYSGGGSGSNSTGSGAVGGGGGSYNTGTNQINTGGAQSGNGLVIISYNTNGLTVSASLSNTAGICPGGSVTLNATAVSSYTWSTGSNAPSISVSPNATSSYTVYGTNSTGCVSSAVLNVSVNPQPPVTIASTKGLVCRGDTATLQAMGASTYTWANGVVSPTLSISPLVNTIYTITGTSAQACTNTAMMTVYADALQLTSTPDTAICAGKSILLSASGANSGSYFWTNNLNASTSPFQTYQVTPAAPTIYSVSGVDANNCTITRSFSVGINPNPTVTATASKTLLCEGESVTLSGFGATTYSWSNNALLQSIVVTPTTNTVYKVNGTTASACSASASVSLKVYVCAGIEQVPSSTPLLSIFPNPSKGLFTVSVNNLTVPSSVKIYSALGNLVKEQILLSDYSEIDLQQETSGLYFIYFVKDNANIYISKIIKE